MVSRRWLVVAGLVALGTSLAASAQVQGPDKMPLGILTNSGQIPPDQVKTIETYIQSWVQNLGSDRESQIQAGREHLLDPLSQGGTANFLAVYNQHLATALADSHLLESSKPLVRLNVMIVLARVQDPAVIPMIQAGLEDAAPAIRYWAAKAVATLAGGGTAFSDKDRQALIQSLTAAAGKEKVESALGMELIALARQPSASAWNNLLTLLDDRLAAHRKDVELDITPERQALIDMVARLGQQVIANPASATQYQAAMTHSVQTLYRYVDLALLALGQTPPVSDNAKREYQALVDDASNWLLFFLRQADAKVKLPSVNDLVRQGNVPEALLRFEDSTTSGWCGQVQRLYKLTAGDLALPPK